MKIIEYKRHLINGCIVDPEFVVHGGNFYNPADNTWVGAILDAADRMYYVPDSIAELTRDLLVQRQLAIHNSNPVRKLFDPTNPHSQLINLTDEEVIESVDNFINSINL